MATELVPVGGAEDLKSGEMRYFNAAGAEIVVARVHDEYYAFAAVCSHALGYLDQGDLRGYEVQCPLHAGRFDIRTGLAVQYPAEDPIASYEVVVDKGQLYVRLEQGTPS